MILLFLVNLYLGFNLSENKSNVTPNDYQVGIKMEFRENRVIYSMERDYGFQNYSFISNLTFIEDKKFVGVQNNCDISKLGIYREDIGIGLLYKGNNVKQYLTSGISMQKYQQYEPCLRYGILYQVDKKIKIPSLGDTLSLNWFTVSVNWGIRQANSLLNMGYKWTYETRASGLVTFNRYEYSLESSTRLYVLKNLGWEANFGYGKYNNIENHFAGWKAFVNF